MNFIVYCIVANGVVNSILVMSLLCCAYSCPNSIGHFTVNGVDAALWILVVPANVGILALILHIMYRGKNRCCGVGPDKTIIINSYTNSGKTILDTVCQSIDIRVYKHPWVSKKK